MKAIKMLALCAGLVFGVAGSAVAQPGHGFSGHGGFSGGAHFAGSGGYHGGYHGGGWGGRGHWAGGGWYGGVYINPWWVAGAYPYYGYPDAYGYDAYPGTAVVQAAPPAVVEQAPPAGAQRDWFYCRNPAGYYPYVSNCSQGWERVPATPPGAQ